MGQLKWRQDTHTLARDLKLPADPRLAGQREGILLNKETQVKNVEEIKIINPLLLESDIVSVR